MGFVDFFRALFAPYPESTRATIKEAAPGVPLDERPVPSGRASIDNPTGSLSQGWVVVEPTDYEGQWRLQDLDINTLDNITPKELLDMLLDLSPEISKAAWDFLRLCNPGYSYKAFTLGEDGAEDEAAKLHLDFVFATLRQKYGSVDVVLNRFFMGAFLRGAFCGELVLDSGATETVDLAAPDPYSIRFRKRPDALLKEFWEPGQFQGSAFVSLDIPTFKYIPVDPAPASPYGRSLAAPALFTAVFILSVMHDVKRVIMQQGYKRLNIVVNTEQAMDNFSYDPQGFASLGAYIKGAIEAFRTTYARLQPDDALIMTDLFSLESSVGTADSDSIGAIDKMFGRLEKMASRALKSSALVMDVGESTNETDSNRKWEIHVAGVKSLQHHCENMLESLLGVSLQAKGIQARVEFRFAELRASEMFRDEQTRTLRIQNARAEYEAGYTSQDEASMNAVGHNADAPEPRNAEDNTELLENNNNGEEALNQNSDDRAIAISQKPVILVRNGIPEGVYQNGHGTAVETN
jgi:hypothetical protein